jgi:glycosyltransferase involved in cell wall biosynthesis
MSAITLSIVTPTYNEEETIEACIKAVAETMHEYDPQLLYEHIIIDNASTDSTISKALKWSSKDPRVIVALNEKNIGGTRNIYRGLSLTRGNLVVPMLPADLQDPAKVIPEFLDAIEPETNVVFGVRKNRQESLRMRALRNIYYRIIRKFAAEDLPLHSGEFCLITRTVVDALVEIKDENPYVRGLIAQSARNPKYVEYTWVERQAGMSKASPFVLAEVAITGLVSTSQIPARLALLAGFGIATLSLFWAAIQVLITVFFGRATLAGIPTIVTAIFFFGGVQLFFTGLIGEYILSIHRQIKPAPFIETKIISG